MLTENHFIEAARLAGAKGVGPRGAMSYLFISAGYGHLIPGGRLKIVQTSEVSPFPETRLPTIPGRQIQVCISGYSIKALATEHGYWVSRCSLCGALGYNESTLTNPNPRGWLVPKLKAAGYSNTMRGVQEVGISRNPIKCISLADAEIAVRVMDRREKAAA